MPSRRRTARPVAPGDGAGASRPTSHDVEAPSSPAERFAAAKRRGEQARTELGAFTDGLDFPLDDFQQRACEALEAGRGVLVAAPTGAGKTVVGEFAVHLALAHGTKAFYTTPIKALSNQKFAEFAARHGADRVGLLTGDTAVNSEAEIVVMTTEVLRNMLYASSPTLQGLEYVVMDEVHYLADKDRGAVWEEVILQLPQSAKVVSLSATVSNAEEFGGWLEAVRGATDVIVSEHRPVPLWQHVMVGSELLDLFAEDVSFESSADSGAVVNPELVKLARRSPASLSGGWGEHTARVDGRGGRGRQDRGRRRGRPGPRGDATGSGSLTASGGQRSRGASRPATVASLDDAGLLPAIVFVFSRKGCDAAVAQNVRAGVDLTTRQERRQIEEVLEQAARRLPAEDLEVVGYWAWRDGMLRGIASHHAGLIPVFKEAVEQLFARGLCKVVYATETLALGVNMPARSVVLEKLDKFNGETHAPVTPGEYTQLTGRAGRRGIDVEGHAVVSWHQGMDPLAVAGLASRRTYPLNSSFRPTYNMSLNLLSRLGVRQARSVLEQSFAQYQADASVVGLARQLAGRKESLTGYEQAMTCHLGDFQEYARLRQRLNKAQKSASKSRGRARRSSAELALEAVGRGDIVEIRGPRNLGHAVVTHLAPSFKDPRPTILTLDGRLRRLSAADLDGPLEVLGTLRVPKTFTGRSPQERNDLASSLRNALRDARPDPHRRTPGFAFAGDEDPEALIDELERKLKRHPCHGCPEREQHARWAERYQKLKVESDRLESQIMGRTHTIARTFDRVTAVLRSVGYVRGEGEAARITDAGHTMLRIYGERDLLTALVLGEGGLQGLSPAAMAAAATLFVYQPKRDAEAGPRHWPQGVRDVWDLAVAQWSRLEDLESDHRVELTPAPEAGLVDAMHRWACGEDLASALAESQVEAGDFVRWAKQVIDFLGQLAQNPAVAPEVSDTASAASDLIRRGVVAASAVVSAAVGGEPGAGQGTHDDAAGPVRRRR
ncbi:RNA helicase [Galactobacter valiniphilus]|uniref:RNA helicase n=1 Tax=Galactobacter valiniphilus TaxID=2676122 RepID=A0A399JD51_9MICC|nr:DEAD/DEAH box helicase [Galactobacter valiniphilus]RII42179.1 RNA helicase [Galactobacter valiniphilus]